MRSIELRLLPIALLCALLAACGGDDDSTTDTPTESDYDDIAQSVAALVVTEDGDGDVKMMSDLHALSIGVEVDGASGGGDFEFARGGLSYRYDVSCGGNCEPGDATVEASFRLNGDITLRRFQSEVDSNGSWTLSARGEDGATFNGGASFTTQSQVLTLGGEVRRSLYISANSRYANVRFDADQLAPVQGSISYDLVIDRYADGLLRDVDARFEVSAVLSFRDGGATLTLDGDREYLLELANGTVVHN